MMCACICTEMHFGQTLTSIYSVNAPATYLENSIGVK